MTIRRAPPTMRSVSASLADDIPLLLQSLLRSFVRQLHKVGVDQNTTDLLE